MCENSKKYGLKYEGWPESCSVESKDVQNGPEKSAARKSCLAKCKKNLEARGEPVKKLHVSVKLRLKSYQGTVLSK